MYTDLSFAINRELGSLRDKLVIAYLNCDEYLKVALVDLLFRTETLEFDKQYITNVLNESLSIESSKLIVNSSGLRIDVQGLDDLPEDEERFVNEVMKLKRKYQLEFHKNNYSKPKKNIRLFDKNVQVDKSKFSRDIGVEVCSNLTTISEVYDNYIEINFPDLRRVKKQGVFKFKDSKVYVHYDDDDLRYSFSKGVPKFPSLTVFVKYEGEQVFLGSINLPFVERQVITPYSIYTELISELNNDGMVFKSPLEIEDYNSDLYLVSVKENIERAILEQLNYSLNVQSYFALPYLEFIEDILNKYRLKK